MTKLSKVFIDAPGSAISYTMDWSDWLTTGDTLTSSSWNVPSGLSSTGSSFDGDSSTIQISGGTACQSYELTNYINTSGGESTNRSFVVYFRNW